MHIIYVESPNPEDWERNIWRCSLPADAINRTGRHTACSQSRAEFLAMEPTSAQTLDVIVLHGDMDRVISKAAQAWHDAQVLVLWNSDKRSAMPEYPDLRCYTSALPTNHEGIVLGWRASQAGLHAFVESGLLSALQRLLQARQQVKLLVFAAQRALCDQLALPGEQLLYLPWTPTTNWGWALSHVDVGLAPACSDGSNYTGRMSLIEYQIMKTPWIASDLPAYQDLRSYGWLVKHTPRAWERVLFDMVDHLPDHRLEVAGAPYLYGLTQSIDDHVDELLGVYQQERRSLPAPRLQPAFQNHLTFHHRITRASMASRQVAASKYLIFDQAATAALAQANLTAQHMLPLIP